jgi:hypothetical protein
MPTSPTTYTFLFLGKLVDSRYAAAAKEDEKISSYAQAQAQAQTRGEGGEHTHAPMAVLQRHTRSAANGDTAGGRTAVTFRPSDLNLEV